MDRRTFLTAGASLPLGWACTQRAAGPAAARPRNLLVLLADDMGWRDLGCYGSRNVRTPTIDALASRGRVWTRAYTAVGVCQPSRSSMLTGLYPHRHGALGFEPIRAGVATWPELLRARGVATALIGKLDVDPIEQFPFDYLIKSRDMPSRRDPELFARHLDEFLRAHPTQPFAAVVAYSDPHRPFEEERTQRECDPASVVVPGNLWDTPQTRDELAQYYDCIGRLDRAVAQALEVVRRNGRADDTLVVFTADNGPSFPFAKSTLFEAGVRMPLIAAGPGVEPGRCDDFVSLLDVLPTALELAGGAVPELDGRSLLAPDAAARAEFVSMQTENNREQATPARALHSRRWSYIRTFGPQGANVSNVINHTAAWESAKELARTDAAVEARMRSLIYPPRESLYDLERDPWQLDNLAEQSEHSAELARQRERLRAWMQRHADPLLAEWDQ